MGSLATALVVLVILVVLAFCLRVWRFGGIGPAFSRNRRSERQALSAARKRVRNLSSQRYQETSTRAKAAKDAKRAYETNLKAARARLEHLQDPGAGKELHVLGKAKLYERAIWLNGTALALSQVHSVRTSYTGSVETLIVQGVDGRLHSVGFSLVVSQRTLTGPPSAEFSSTEVQAFARHVHNAIIAEKEWRRALPQMIREAEQGLAIASTDTAAMREAEAQLKQVEAASSTAEALALAEKELADLERNWTQG